MAVAVDQANRKPLASGVEDLGQVCASETEHGHAVVHLIERVGIVVVVMMQQHQRTLDAWVAKGNPLGRREITGVLPGHQLRCVDG